MGFLCTVGQSNTNTYVIASYYLKYVNRLGIPSRIIRTDYGIENQIVNFLQTY